MVRANQGGPTDEGAHSHSRARTLTRRVRQFLTEFSGSYTDAYADANTERCA
jgi:hypothetical protein